MTEEFRKRFRLLFALLLTPIPSFAFGISDAQLLDPRSFLSNPIPENIATEAVKTFGIYSAHRSYTGATSIAHSNTLDILVEATMVKLGSGLIDALNQNKFPNIPQAVPAIPVAKVMIRKALGFGADIGFSALVFEGQSILGGDLKIVLHDAEEGPSYAFLLGYTYSKLPLAYLKDVTVISPEFILSKRLDFAESYIGIGGRYIHGTLSFPFDGFPPSIPSITIEKEGHAYTAYALTGVFFRILGAQGLRLGIEGSYDISGFPTMGLVAGLGF